MNKGVRPPARGAQRRRVLETQTLMQMLRRGMGAGVETAQRWRCCDKATMPSVLQSLGLSHLSPLGFVWGSVGKLSPQRPRAWHRVIQDWRAWCQQSCQPMASSTPAILCVCMHAYGRCVCGSDARGVPSLKGVPGQLTQACEGGGGSRAGIWSLVRKQGRASTHSWAGQPPPKSKPKAWARMKLRCKVHSYVESRF